MSKAGDFVKKVEEEISEFFAGADSGAYHSEYEMEADNLAMPEIHTGKAVDRTGEKDREDRAGEDGQEKDKKPTIHYDGLAVPEIHIPHQK